ncbi:hypothetical protein [Alkalihalobacterium sp. APHAB7]|uniref:hypothetical protein n=1 Tax=Alkalihalobacterium sp. APHAB7 TaxID=3402081 RepID=UPI003AAC45A8
MRTNQLLNKTFITIYILSALFLFSVYIGLFFYVDLFAFFTTIQDKEFHFAISSICANVFTDGEIWDYEWAYHGLGEGYGGIWSDINGCRYDKIQDRNS